MLQVFLDIWNKIFVTQLSASGCRKKDTLWSIYKNLDRRLEYRTSLLHFKNVFNNHFENSTPREISK